MNKSDFSIVYEGKYAGLKDKCGEIVLPCEYDKILDYDDDGYIRFIKDGIYGTIDLEGNVCIPLTEKLSHLGVFHKGTARARINDSWGLVDVNGVHITGFIYKSIAAHRQYGYKAVTLKGKRGILLEDGTFGVSPKIYKFNSISFSHGLLQWLGEIKPLDFYYRDTDADIDVNKLYKPGHFIRTDCCMQVTRKLLRPVHKIRFLIIARRLLDVDNSTQERRLVCTADFKEFVIPANMNFLVVDVQQCGGVTQIVLLHLPHGAMLLAKHFKISLSTFNPYDIKGNYLKDAARYDLLGKMCNYVHGYSIDEEWCDAMHQPVGCDAQLNLNKLIMDDSLTKDSCGDPNINALRLLGDCDEEWTEDKFCVSN